MIQNHLAFFVCAVISLTSSFAFAGGVIKIHADSKTGPVLLVVDDESVRKSAGGKPILWIDDKKVLTEKDGEMVFFMPGDICMTKPDGDVCGYVDGRNIRANPPAGKQLFYIDGPNIKEPDVHGKLIYYIDGDVMNNQQLMAVLFTLRPDAIKRPGGMPKRGAVAATPAAPVTPEAPATPAATAGTFNGGTYSIYLYQSSDGTKHKGKIAFTPVGDVFVMDLQFTDSAPWQGVAVYNNGEIWAAIGAPNTVGLAVYKVDAGNLAGTWMNATGDPSKEGSENLAGPTGLSGKYEITSAKAPFTGAPYAGTVTIDKLDTRIGKGEQPFVHLTWDFGTLKIEGPGYALGKNLIAASSTAKDCAIVRFKVDPKTGNLMGDFCTAAKGHGSYTLTKE